MTRAVFALFDNRGDAEDALSSLKDEGFSPKDVSVIMRDMGKEGGMRETRGQEVARGAVSGATTGGVIGAIAGLLVGVGAIAVPGIGGLLIGGPIATALGLTGAAATTVSGAVTGILAGGLVGGLARLGVPEEEARVYERRIKQGAILFAIPVMEREEDQVKDMLEDYGATNVKALTLNGEFTRKAGAVRGRRDEYEEEYGREDRMRHMRPAMTGSERISRRREKRHPRRERMEEEDEET